MNYFFIMFRVYLYKTESCILIMHTLLFHDVRSTNSEKIFLISHKILEYKKFEDPLEQSVQLKRHHDIGFRRHRKFHPAVSDFTGIIALDTRTGERRGDLMIFKIIFIYFLQRRLLPRARARKKNFKYTFSQSEGLSLIRLYSFLFCPFPSFPPTLSLSLSLSFTRVYAISQTVKLRVKSP